MVSRAVKIGAAVGGGALILLLLAGGDGAKDVIFVPDEPEPDPIPPPNVDPPPPPAPGRCNFVGCPGFKPSNTTYANAKSPERLVGLRLQQLGYSINPAAANFSLLSPYERGVVAQFQRETRKVRNGFPDPKPPYLDDDGLAGNLTIAWIERAHGLVITRRQTWKNIVALSI